MQNIFIYFLIFIIKVVSICFSVSINRYFYRDVKASVIIVSSKRNSGEFVFLFTCKEKKK